MSGFSNGLKCAAAAVALVAIGVATPAMAQTVKLGALMGITGPIANLVPAILDSAKLAVAQVNANGGILDGQELVLVVGDTQGTAQGGVDAATKLVNIDNVTAVVGALMSGPNISAANSVFIPNGVVGLSPTSTSPEVTGLDDNDLIFRVVPSDNYQGEVLARLVLSKGIDKVALSFVNDDYGVGIAGAFRDAYTAAGGVITGDQVHEPKKTSFRSELATLAGGDAQALVLIAFAGDTGVPIVRQSLEGGMFDSFIGTDALRDTLLIEQIGAENLGSTFFTSPSSPPASTAAEKFQAGYLDAYPGADLDAIFINQSYDSAFLLALAIEKAGTADRDAISAALREVAGPPGMIIEPGEWAKAKAAIAAGEDIDYSGVSGGHDFDSNGDVSGVIGHYVVDGDGFTEVGLVD